ncbi:MAG: zinc ribbon domain-containing protein [Dehalococcoidia bacterium]
MIKGRQLYELQEVDLEIEAKGEALSRVESRLGEREALDEASASLSRERELLAELERSQRLGEGEVEDLRAKTALLEGRLYSGSVRNPKELTSLQEQVEHLKKRRRGQEDQLLDIMTEVEAVQQRVNSKSGELEGMEKSWREEQNSLSREQAELRAALATLEQRRKELIVRIDSVSLELYQTLRVKRQGRAVAKVERGMCQGCRIVLPMTELQRARMGEEIVQCSSCERILYVS